MPMSGRSITSSDLSSAASSPAGGAPSGPVTQTQRRLRSLRSLIGNTPVLAIDFEFRNQRRTLYAKAEYLSLTGSIKDRMSFHIIEKGYESGLLEAGDLIVEATSGNTGIAMAGVGRAMGHPVTIFMPDWMSTERKNLLKSLGASIELVSSAEGGFLECIRRSEDLVGRTPRAFLPRQFSNEANVDAHFATTGPEIWWQLRFHGLEPDGFVAGVGTGGTIMGVGRFLRKMNPRIAVHPLEPANSPTLSTGHKTGRHRIQGISDDFIPPIVDLKAMDAVVGVDDGDAILMAQKLAAELGLGVGLSSGANFIGALMVQNRLGPGSVVATVFADDNKKYLSTDLLRTEPARSGFLSPEVRLLSFRGIKRVCHTCCDPDECLADAGPEAERFPLPACARRPGGA